MGGEVREESRCAETGKLSVQSHHHRYLHILQDATTQQTQDEKPKGGDFRERLCLSFKGTEKGRKGGW
jgi:hypothetical protein